MSSPLVRLKNLFTARATRELLAWCLPALLIGLALRVVLTVHLPYAYYHDDAPDFLFTTEAFLKKHSLTPHEKKTFLVPVLFTLPFALPVPAAITIPIFQHILGLGLVLMIGALCRLWLRHWKVWIIPLTVLTAINPFFLWFEHTLMAETVFVCSTVFLALAGTLYVRQPSVSRLVVLLVSLVLVAGARPEGKLLFGFGLLLVALVHLRELRTYWKRLALVAVVALATHCVTKTSQAGLLLYTSLARLTPPDLQCAPGFDPYIAPMRTDLQNRWALHPQFPAVRDRRVISAVVKQYMTDQLGKEGRISAANSNAFCLKLAKETCLRNLTALPGLALTKFRLAATGSMARPFNNDLFFDKQREAYLGNLDRTKRLAPGLLGVELADEAAVNQWIDTHYGEVPWFNVFTDRWLRAVNHWHLPDKRYPRFVYPGVPLYFLAGALGLLVIMLRRGELQRFHVAWGLTLLGFFFTIMITANVRARFRFVFEPFWFIYLALLVECGWLSLRGLFHRSEKKESSAPTLSEAL